MPNRIVIHFLETFGRLHVLREVARRGTQLTRSFDCICDCPSHNVVTVYLGHLRSSDVTSCGCWQSEEATRRSTIHGQYKTKEYKALQSINQRCYNPKDKAYKHYGGRGITVCPEWRSMGGFNDFLAYMGRSPSPKHSIDRWPDPNGNYEKNNVRWATARQQARNRRDNNWINYKGERRLLIELSEEHGLSIETVLRRMGKGCSLERLFDPLIPAKDRPALRKTRSGGGNGGPRRKSTTITP